MAPSKPPAKKSNKASGRRLGASKDLKSRVSKPSGSGGGVKRPAPTEQKSKRPDSGSAAGASKKKQRRFYSEKELGISALNTVTPVGVQKPRGKKKGKVFVDDAQSMMTIMAMVNAEKEGQIESKMMRARQMEEIRALKRQEQEERETARKDKLEATKDSLRKKRARKGLKLPADSADDTAAKKADEGKGSGSKKKKRVSFG